MTNTHVGQDNPGCVHTSGCPAAPFDLPIRQMYSRIPNRRSPDGASRHPMPISCARPGGRAVGLSRSIVGRFSRDHRELRFKNTMIPLPYPAAHALSVRAFAHARVCVWLHIFAGVRLRAYLCWRSLAISSTLSSTIRTTAF